MFDRGLNTFLVVKNKLHVTSKKQQVKRKQ